MTKQVFYYSIFERILRILKGIYSIISTFGYAFYKTESRNEIFQLFFEKAKFFKHFATRYEYNDGRVNGITFKMLSEISQEMIEFLNKNPTFEEFKGRCSETGFVVNLDEMDLIATLEKLNKNLATIASISDKKNFIIFSDKG
ncbi:MAG: hypothetical protein H0W50_05285 [Parachlamydiaceae bacterium]|nr:hypothetical protein [Parachlamydiaceae bacterium]